MFDPIKLIDKFNKKDIQYLLIGRQAVIQYGAPLVSADFDFWVHPRDRQRTFDILVKEFEAEPSCDVSTKRPFIHFYLREDNVDVFFVKTISTSKGKKLQFDECYKNSVRKSESKTDFFVRIPSLADLIKLKETGREKDKVDIDYLKKVKH